MPFDTLKYTKCVVIVHGKSEFHLVRFIYTNLHLPVKIISKDKGRGSIQINGLKEFLNKKFFKTLKNYNTKNTFSHFQKIKINLFIYS